MSLMNYEEEQMDKEHIIKLNEDDWTMILAILKIKKKEILKGDALKIQKIEDKIKQQIKEQIENGN